MQGIVKNIKRVFSNSSMASAAPGGGTPVGIIGNGTSNKLAKFTAGTTIGDSQIFDDGTFVGIGTVNPTFRFEVIHSPSNYFKFGGSNTFIQQSTDSFLSFGFNASDDVHLWGKDINIYNPSSSKNFKSTSSGDIGAYYSYNMFDFAFRSYNNVGINIFEVNHTGHPENRLGVNVTPTATIHVKGVDSTSSNYSFKAENSSGAFLQTIRNDGRISEPLLPTSNVGLTTGDRYVATAAQILANGDLVVGWKV